MIPKAVKLREFLEASNLEVAKMPPWIHSTSAHNIWEIMGSGKILAMACDVFRPEKLCYCFVGRPAYKRKDEKNVEDWQLPMAFVLRFQTEPKIKRVFPFDSGAFRNKRLPSYITCFKIDGYELSGDMRNVGRLISLLYKNPKRYFDRKAAGFEELKEEHNLLPRHQEVMAVSRLALDSSSMECDDRAAAIEVSLEQDIVLNPRDMLGVVIPDEYKREPELVTALKELTPFIEYYRHNPINHGAHYGQIYDAVQSIYKRAGVPL